MIPSNGFNKNPQNINKNGRPPKEQSLTDILIALSEGKKRNINGIDYDWKEALGVKLWEMAFNGDIHAIKYLYNRVDGSPKQSLSVSNGQEDKLAELMEKISEIGIESERGDI